MSDREIHIGFAAGLTVAMFIVGGMAGDCTGRQTLRVLGCHARCNALKTKYHSADESLCVCTDGQTAKYKLSGMYEASR